SAADLPPGVTHSALLERFLDFSRRQNAFRILRVEPLDFALHRIRPVRGNLRQVENQKFVALDRLHRSWLCRGRTSATNRYSFLLRERLRPERRRCGRLIHRRLRLLRLAVSVPLRRWLQLILLQNAHLRARFAFAAKDVLDLIRYMNDSLVLPPREIFQTQLRQNLPEGDIHHAVIMRTASGKHSCGSNSPHLPKWYLHRALGQLFQHLFFRQNQRFIWTGTIFPLQFLR